MKNSTLVFRSLAIIIFVAGIAHLASYASQSEAVHYNYNEPTEVNSEQDLTEGEDTVNTSDYNLETDYIIGNWKVNYNSKDFKGAVVCNIKKEGEVYNAYTHQYLDEKGYSEKAEGAKTLTIKSFDGYKGKGVYIFDYENEKHQVDCQIDMVDENTFKLSYDYYGYSDVETWKRQ